MQRDQLGHSKAYEIRNAGMVRGALFRYLSQQYVASCCCELCFLQVSAQQLCFVKLSWQQARLNCNTPAVQST